MNESLTKLVEAETCPDEESAKEMGAKAAAEPAGARPVWQA